MNFGIAPRGDKGVEIAKRGGFRIRLVKNHVNFDRLKNYGVEKVGGKLLDFDRFCRGLVYVKIVKNYVSFDAP
jgi:hypothetical protein